ncbi:hypothetical protein SAMN05216344_106130 [Polaromonas sp. OV174]|uniref:hypothetical protein n=1 Tax=Polaromonas sp. OV174 TaxID=1855300 RepID=UPI0008ECE3A7|nr:hypothetical protein [Polaromonas sp. OV174]SFB96807.1 hypothetical protein SAMN05216344_106130 [Polaromonas sp. OV174]
MTDIVAPPEAPVVPPYPALGSPNFNAEAYAYGSSMPAVTQRQQEIGQAAYTNAVASKEQALAGQATHEQAVFDVTNIKNAAVAETTAIKNAAVNETTGIKDQAKGFRDEAALSAQAAQSAADFVGRWADLAGPLAPPATAWHGGKFWVLLDALADVAAAEPGVSAAWSVVGSEVPHIAYDDRATLRTAQTAVGDQAIVAGLGLFVLTAASDEPDDDETCFAHAAGKWLLESAHPDLLAAWELPDDDARDELGSILRATAACPLTTIAATSSAAFMASVAGATVGCAVLASPLAALDARLAVTARVTTPGAVTITLNNPSAAATTAGGVPANWQITVFKEF